MSINIAVSKGRVLKEVMKLFSNSGYIFDDLNTRKLILKSQDALINVIIVKASDVPLYVDNSFAELGIVGNDVIGEYSNDFYELLNLNIGICDLCIAAKKDFSLNNQNFLKIATKYPMQAKKYLKKSNRKGSIIKLNGSVELGPLLGISDCILDIVETGNTLKENNLFVKEKFKSINSIIIANKIYYKTKFKEIDEFINTISNQMMEEC
ncbi:MAG: ATP phosphoribosyltransferase [Bacillota bacterium]|nr:ATP phosphoribosyltransferase [Bacillota bacterium]